MQPYQACIAEKIQNMDEWNGQKQNTTATSPINIEDSDSADEYDH